VKLCTEQKEKQTRKKGMTEIIQGLNKIFLLTSFLQKVIEPMISVKGGAGLFVPVHAE
jgi:hypothetical protein